MMTKILILTKRKKGFYACLLEELFKDIKEATGIHLAWFGFDWASSFLYQFCSYASGHGDQQHLVPKCFLSGRK
jgi:hypothetical protein